MVARSTVMTHNWLQSPGFDCNWNSLPEGSVSVEDSEVPVQALATHGGTEVVALDRPKVMVNGKEVGSKLTKADFAVKADCSVCRMVKTAALWVRQKDSGCTADGSSQIVLERTIICKECYERVCA